MPTLSLPKDAKQLKKIDKLLEIRDKRIEFATKHHRTNKGTRLVFSDMPYLRDIYNTLAEEMVIQSSVQSGKALSVNAKVHTPEGWKRMGDIAVNDVVTSVHGGICSVSGVFPQGVRQLYRVCLEDGRWVDADSPHLWQVFEMRSRNMRGRLSAWEHEGSKVYSTAELLVRMQSGKYRYSIPTPVAVEKREKDLYIPPYLMGLLLGDGCLGVRKISFSTGDSEVLAELVKLCDELGVGVSKDTGYDFYLTRCGHLRDALFLHGLLGKKSYEKHIPWAYKNGSIEQRLAVLQGLLDTDGTACKQGGVIFCSTSQALAKDVQEIVWSLGGCTAVREKVSSYTHKGEKLAGRKSYLVRISLPCPKDAFRLARKKDRVSEVHRRLPTFGTLITDILPVGSEDACCISVDDPSGLYITDNYVVTHNTEFLIVDHFAHAACGLDLFYVMPKYELRNRFVQNRVDKSIAYSPEYKKYASKGRNKVSLDSCSLKSFGDRTIIYAGSNTTADFREAPADAAFVDEMQECDLNNLQLLTDRLTFSDYKFRKWAGNPQVSGCDINFEYNLSDQRAWNVPCKSCGKLSILDWFDTVVDGQMDGSGIIHRYHLRDKEWSPGRFRDIHAICPHCGGILDRFTNGKWIPRADNLREGYWISKLITGKTPFMELWTQFQGCLDSQTLLQWFYNSNLGLPFATQGSQLTANMLDDCATLPAFVVSGRECFTLDKKHPGPCSMGVDVGKFFDVRISFPTNGERHAVFIGKVQSIEDLHELIERFHVQVCVIDAGPDIHTIPEFQDTAKCDVWTCKYSPSEGQDGYPKYNSKDMRIVVDRTFILDKGHSHLKRRINKLPVNYRALLEGAYIAEMTSSVRKLVMTANGNNRFEWRCNSDAIADHQRHADAYDILAFDMMDVGSSGFAFEVF